MNDIPERYIYESPDGGHTIYRRPFNQLGPKELVSISDEAQAKQDIDALWIRWIPILRASREDHILKDMLDKIIVYHDLKDSP
jgi:hypothetical protein